MEEFVSRQPLKLATSVSVLRVTQDSTVNSLAPAVCPVTVTFIVIFKKSTMRIDLT